MSLPVFALFLSLSGACVPAQKYRELESSYQAALEDAQDKDARIRDLEDDLERLQARVEALESQIEQLQATLDQKSRALDAALEEKAHLLADRGKLSEDVARMKQALSELEARKAAAEARVRDYQSLLARFRKLIDAGKLRVKIVDGRMVVELPNDVLFASGSAELSPEGEEALREVAKVLAEIPDRSFQVEGHTDDVPIHTQQFPSNWELAAARAITVVKTLVDAGMDPARLSAASFAEYRPAAPNDTEEGRAANRRIEIAVVPDLSALPGYEELRSLGAEPPPPRPPRRRHP